MALFLCGCFCCVCADSIRALDARYFVGPVDVPDTTYYAGYSMWLINSTRICETYVSDECVVKKGAEACVEEQVRRQPQPCSSTTCAQQQSLPGAHTCALCLEKLGV